jgi:RHS repeat-associated protein
LISKEVGGDGMNRLQNVDYTYNIRGWLTDINNVDQVMDGTNDDLFSFKISYDNPGGNGTPLYNGNISKTHWLTSRDPTKSEYTYRYDGLNRLQNAHYNTPINLLHDGNYDEGVQYDKNGNITYLERNGYHANLGISTPIDILSYHYDPNSKNQLKKVVDLSNSQRGFKDDSNGTIEGDPTDDYQYDLNGNMTQDQNKNITSIVYNHLNLPTKINFGTGSTITYLYNATGVKLKKVVTDLGNNSASTTEYLGGFQYNNAVLQFIFTPEGYVNNTVIDGVNHYNYVYNYTDHLGNIRLSYSKDEETQVIEILQTHHYYPFGLEHISWLDRREYVPISVETFRTDGSKVIEKRVRLVQVANSGYQYQYNGKEWQDEMGLGVYDYGARIYDPAVPRFWQVDPLAEKYNFQSPYVYANNSPVLFMDINGMGVDTDFVLDKDGHITRKDPNDGSEKNLNDRLYASDDKGNATENYLEIKKEKATDNTLISNMTTNNIQKWKTTYADDIPITIETNISMSTSKTEAFNFFKFVTDNSNTEWSLSKFTNGKQIFYQLGTYHNTWPYTDASPGFLFRDNNGYKWLGSVHSHYSPTKLSDSGFLGDFNKAIDYREQYGAKLPYLIYHPNVKGKPTVNVVYGRNRVTPHPTFKF